MSAPVPFSEALRLDAELVWRTRGASALRLALGGALEALSVAGGYYDLGFSSFEAYARERCERTGRWAADTRALAGKLESLPKTRAALTSGAIGWSTAELLARHVTSASELAWLEKARGVTVRELRTLLAQGAESSADDEEDEPRHDLAIRATREDAWLFECAREVARAVGDASSPDRLLQSLLAEGYSTLLELVPNHSALLEISACESQLDAESRAHENYCAERKHWREEAEKHCESRCSAAEFDTREGAFASPGEETRPGESTTPEALDRRIRRLCIELCERELSLGVAAERANKADVTNSNPRICAVTSSSTTDRRR